MIIDDLFSARDQAERLRMELSELLSQEPQATHKVQLREEVRRIQNALETSQVPEYFRVAVVGTFKTGKSSFVNKLANEKLAGVETNPETAAISVFRYGDSPRAEVSLISSGEWARMEELYEDEPKHPEAFRVAGLHDFNDRMAKRKDKKGNPIPFEPIDPKAMAEKWLKPDGALHVIDAENWDTKEGKIAFRKAIRGFTSSRDPMHYFVKELAIHAPVPLLKNHVELIDTPGLNDTQLYRGQLTEDLLSEVNAILFLTRSGASFSQYDKDFIVRQLRKKRLRHLILVVTQIDTTYESARRDALDEDEDPPSLNEVIQKEETRLRTEINRTLNELLEDSNLNEEDGYYYLEQLEALKIYFTSSRWVDDGRIAESGIPAVRDALELVLSENYHLQQLADHLTQTMDSIRSRLRSFFDERRSVMEAEFDPKKVQESMAEIEASLIQQLDAFEQSILDLTGAHETEQTALTELMEAKIALMQSMARDVVSEFEKNDVARHWKSRRHRNWGYLSVLGEKVADKIFPVMEMSLRRKIKPFGDFLDLASGELDGLQSEVSKLELKSAVEGLPKIEFSEAKKRFMHTYVEEIKERVHSEKDLIIEVLEKFATEELKQKLSSAKEDVSDVLGTGTTVRQTAVVRAFYDDVNQSLSAALSDFLQDRIERFGTSLNKNADALYPKLRSSIQSLLDTRKQLIQEHLTLQTGEAKARLEEYLETGISVLDGKTSAVVAASEEGKILKELDIQIEEGQSGFGYDTLFGPYFSSSARIDIKEPYLRFWYQLNNFKHFCGVAVRSGPVKEIELITGSLVGEEREQSDSFLEDVKRHLASDFGVQFNWTRDGALHAREIKTDDGWVILSDRGLDLYKKPESRNEFGHFDLALRKCKQTQVHIRKGLN
jgi:predicted GTPase